MECSKQAAELTNVASFHEATHRHDLARLNAYSHDACVQNVGRRSAVEAKHKEAFQLTRYAEDCADKRARAEDQLQQTLAERVLRDKVLVAKVNEIVNKLERSRALRQIQERSRRNQVDHLLQRLYHMATVPTLLSDPFIEGAG